MIVSSQLSIDVGSGSMPAYLSRPGDPGSYPAVIVLEGVYGFDDELKRITDLLASTGYVGLAINYFYRTNPDFQEPFSEAGRAAGVAASRSIQKAQVRDDVAAARDWLNDQPFVDSGRVGTWGFGFGGTVGFVTSTLPGILAAVVFYGQSIDTPMPSGEAPPIEDAKQVRAPLLLVFGGADELITPKEIEDISTTLTDCNKKFQMQLYPNVGHSFFRATMASVATREAADAWDLVQAFFGRNLR
jgi:carboxymethylenebutenolidase